MKLPSRFQIGDKVLAGRLDGGSKGEVIGVHFNRYKVSYDVVDELTQRTKKHLSERVHPVTE
ncbi:hypothetical protein [Xanthomonas phage X1]|nr:hypothetical protein [Xanthomonas phage X1]